MTATSQVVFLQDVNNTVFDHDCSVADAGEGGSWPHCSARAGNHLPSTGAT